MSKRIAGFTEILRDAQFSRRNVFKTLFISLIPALFGERAFGLESPLINAILGRPTEASIAVSLISRSSASAFVEYGYSPTKLDLKTKVITLEKLFPQVIEINNLKANSKIYYRTKIKDNSTSTFISNEINSFSTAKRMGSEFSFVVIGDSHPERIGKMFNEELYNQTLTNISKQNPDFMIMLGDDFSIDPLIERGQANQTNIEKIYAKQRNWLSKVAKSSPLFLVNGNHEQAAAYLIDGTDKNPAVIAGKSRLKYFPLPVSNNFYSADAEKVDFVGKLSDYFAWTWGDALFITLDPYWHSKNPVDNVAGASVDKSQVGGKAGGKTSNLWSIGIGDTQYEWLKSTLEKSKSKYKFVFSHHVLGTGRGGIEVSTQYEWGGQDPKSKKTFTEMRPNWELPIHDLMVKHGVNIFFQGHDHIFVHQERDGLIYQSMPNPADDTFTMFNDAAYLSGTKAPNSGHVRVTVSQPIVKVEYFLSARSQDESEERQNLKIAHSYSIKV